MTEIEKYNLEKKRQEELEHRDTLLAIASLIKTKEGSRLFGYLFKHFEVAQVPDPGMSGKILHEYLGHLRAGNAIYKLACEACFETAASILSKLEKERYDDLRQIHRIETAFNATTTDYED